MWDSGGYGAKALGWSRAEWSICSICNGMEAITNVNEMKMVNRSLSIINHNIQET